MAHSQLSTLFALSLLDLGSSYNEIFRESIHNYVSFGLDSELMLWPVTGAYIKPNCVITAHDGPNELIYTLSS